MPRPIQSLVIRNAPVIDYGETLVHTFEGGIPTRPQSNTQSGASRRKVGTDRQRG